MSSPCGKRYTAEFERDAVAVVGALPERTLNEVAREVGVGAVGLRGWVEQARTDAGGGAPGSSASAGREQLAALRRRVREQDQVISILKKAAAFFTQDNL